MRLNPNSVVNPFVGLDTFLSGVSYDRIRIQPSTCTNCGPISYLRLGYLLIVKTGIPLIQTLITGFPAYSPLKSSKVFTSIGKEKCAVWLQHFS
jgi:hypothetical protein